MPPYVKPDSIVRKIWGKGDTVLFIFAGAAAEFALNKAVDWLYFTGKLPADPLGRLFSTLSYAQKIVFAENESALKTIDNITNIHKGVEQARGAEIPDWAYRDVLYMLIHYSIASYELLEHKMDTDEKAELYDVFYRMGIRMHLKDLPDSYPEWLKSRKLHLAQDLAHSRYSDDLFLQYKKHLGRFRYWLLWESQKLVVPETARQMLKMQGFSWVRPILFIYKISRRIGLDGLLKAIILPAQYKKQIREIDVKDTGYTIG